MNYSLKKLALAILCVGATGLSLAAQPGSASTTSQVATKVPGVLVDFKVSATEVVAGTPLSIRFEGTGHCKMSVNTGETYQKTVEGDLPFSVSHAYPANLVRASENYTDLYITASVMGNCKIAAGIPGSPIRVLNPTPRSSGKAPLTKSAGPAAGAKTAP
jgi:hypothetical protein